MPAPRPLARSLVPLPGESLPGLLLRLSFRLGVPVGQVAAITGLTPGTGNIPASRMLILDDAVTRAFAAATRLDPAEVTALTLAGLAGRYPPAGLAYLGRQRQPGGIFVKETWVLSRSTRYCPQCLAGDPDSPVQQQLGGAWRKLWRLPVVFACPEHQRLLEHACPACGQPAHLRATHGGGLPSLIPMPAHAAIHPAACRHPQPAGGTARRRQLRTCGHLLTEGRPAPQPEPPDTLGQVLQFQQHLLELLDPRGPAAAVSGGEQATPGEYFTDLRMLACLITVSWPAARDLATLPGQADVISRHAAAARRQASATAEERAQRRQIAYYDTPPLQAAACAALLTLAGGILASDSPGSLSQVIRHLTGPAAVPAFQRWAKWFLAGDGYCSPALRAATGPAVGALHVIRQATAGTSPRKLRPPPRPAAGYSITHVPAYLPARWHEEHLARFAELAPEQLLRRAAALRLARTCTPASYGKLGELLRIPAESAKSTVKTVHSRLKAAGLARRVRRRHRGARRHPRHRAGPHRLRAAAQRAAGLADQPRPVEPAHQRPPTPVLTTRRLGRTQADARLGLGLDPHHQRRAPVRARRDDQPGRAPQPAPRRPGAPELHRPTLAPPRSRDHRPVRRAPAPPQRLRRPDGSTHRRVSP